MRSSKHSPSSAGPCRRGAPRPLVAVLGTLFAVSASACGDTERRLDWRVVSPPNAAGESAGIPDVTVCVDDHPEIECATSDGSGAFTLEAVPENVETVLTLRKKGFPDTIKPFVNQVFNNAFVTLPPIVMPAWSADLDTVLGFHADPALGTMDFFVQRDDGHGFLPGAKVTLSPEQGSGPVYRGQTELDPKLTASTGSGGNFFFNLEAGNYTLTVEPPEGFTCRGIDAPIPLFGYPEPNEPKVRFPVRAGAITANIGVTCGPTR